MSLGITLLLSVVGLVVIMGGSCFYFSFWMQKAVFNQVNDLDYVRAYQLPPERWQKAYLKKCQKLGRIPPKLFNKQKRRNLRHLKGLTKFAKKTILMESEEVREGVLLELSQIRQQWEAEEAPEA